MKNTIFTGAATAIVTPMNEDYSVNFPRLHTLVEEQIEGGIDALVVCGTTGEKSTLRYDEHVKVIELCFVNYLVKSVLVGEKIRYAERHSLFYSLRYLRVAEVVFYYESFFACFAHCHTEEESYGCFTLAGLSTCDTDTF